MIMKPFLTLAALYTALLLAAAPSAHAQAQGTQASAANTANVTETRVVYHVSEVASLRDALNNITNHINSDPGARITLLANARGVYGLTGGERDRQGEYSATISGLQAKGVKFVACSTSMKKNNIDPASLLANVTTVSSGVVEIARLQSHEHYAYIKP